MLFIGGLVNIAADFVGGLLGGGSSGGSSGGGGSVIQPRQVSFKEYMMPTGNTSVSTRRTRAPKAESATMMDPEFYYNSVIRDLLYDLDKLKDKR